MQSMRDLAPLDKPYARKLKRQITIRLEPDVIDYFKSMAKNVHVPYQNLINYYLKDCALTKKQLQFNWK